MTTNTRRRTKCAMECNACDRKAARRAPTASTTGTTRTTGTMGTTVNGDKKYDETKRS